MDRARNGSAGPACGVPDAAVDRQGNLYAAWDSYQNGNYDIFLRRISAAGAPDKIEQVTESPRFEAHPSLAIDGQDRVWLAYDESGANWGKDWSHDDPYRSHGALCRPFVVTVLVKEGGEWKQAGDFRDGRAGAAAALLAIAAAGGGRRRPRLGHVPGAYRGDQQPRRLLVLRRPVGPVPEHF